MQLRLLPGIIVITTGVSYSADSESGSKKRDRQCTAINSITGAMRVTTVAVENH
jgi:hypothetical protein